MQNLVEASLQFPTVGLTIALGIALVYWLCVAIGGLDLDFDPFDGDAADGDGAWFGLGSVPVTVSMSLVVLLSWCASVLATSYLAASASWIRMVVLVLAIIVALPIVALLVRPLAPLFNVREAKSNADYIGQTCTITTGSVDGAFGQATVEDGGTVLVIQVRCDQDARFGRGDLAQIVDFDPVREAYVIAPFLGTLAGA